MNTAKRSKSNSTPQRAVEKIIREKLAKPLDWLGTLEPRPVSYGKKGRMEFDCYGENNGAVLLGEINAHHGKLKPAQQNKVLRDMLKMHAKSEELKQAGTSSVRMVVVFTNVAAENYLKGGSWAAEVAQKFHIESVVVPLKAAQIKVLLKAQKDQDLREA